MPWMVLAASFAAFYARLLRANLIEVMSEDYIRTARAKGLRERRVVLRHGVRAAITPVVTAAGLDIGILLGGAILTETVFNIPGVGLGKERLEPHRDGPDAVPGRPGARRGAVRGTRPAARVGRRATADPRGRDRDDLPGSALVAAPVLQGRVADRGGDPGSPRHE